MTPSDFQNRFGVDAKALRGFLRSRWPHRHNDRWFLDDAMVADACAHFGVGRSDIRVASPPIERRQPPSAPAPSPSRSSGLHRDLAVAARAAGIPLSLGQPVPWLTGRGHLAPIVRDHAPAHVVDALAGIHASLGGDASALARKALGNPPTPDLVHDELGCIVEVDEVQHFTTARLWSFDHYPPDVPLGFDLDEYRRLTGQWRARGDRAFAHKTAADFPRAGGRQGQRAYNDAVRDLLAPTFTGRPVIRLAVPDRSLRGAVQRLAEALHRIA